MDPLVDLFTMLRLQFAAALILSTLVHERRPLSLKELAEATGYTKSHLSSTLRLLEEKRLIKRIRVRGRKYLFQARAEGLIALIYGHLSKIHEYLRFMTDELKDGDILRAMRMLESELRSLLTKLEEYEGLMVSR